MNRKTILITIMTAALTAVGAEAVSSWLPSAARFVWYSVTASRIMYVTVSSNSDEGPLGNVKVEIHSPDPTNEYVIATGVTGSNGTAVIRDLDPTIVLLIASFTSASDLYTYKELLSIDEFPFIVEIPREGSWQVSRIETAKVSGLADAVNAAAEPLERANDPPWLSVALNEIGTSEISGDESNPRIEDYHGATAIGRSSENTPWGCSFVSWVFKHAGVDSSVQSARCVDWLQLGHRIGEPRRGAVAIFEPFVPEALTGFVGFVLESDDETVTVVAGNIQNSVAVARFPKLKVREYRWP